MNIVHLDQKDINTQRQPKTAPHSVQNAAFTQTDGDSGGPHHHHQHLLHLHQHQHVHHQDVHHEHVHHQDETLFCSSDASQWVVSADPAQVAR